MLATSQRKFSQQWITDLFFISIALGIFYAIWIGSHALFTPDEGRYSEVAREMVATGDYITPRVDGVAFLDKPVLYYWLQASAIKLFGIKEWALRFWPAFAGVLGCIIVYIAGRILFSRRAGIISAIILATSPLYYGAAHYANLDLEVATLIGNSLLCFIVAMQLPVSKSRDRFLIAAYTFSGLAVLTKGLIGIAFPMMIIGAWILLLNRWSVLKNMRLLVGMLIFFAITAPWYIQVQNANPEFLHFFFVTQQISRFLTTTDFNNKTPLWFYVPIVLAGFFPWSVFLAQAIYQKIKAMWLDRKTQQAELFLLLWLFIIFIFFSIPRSKTVGYILPIFPCIALLVGDYLNKLWNQNAITHMYKGIIAFTASCGIIGLTFLLLSFLKISAFPIISTTIPYLVAATVTLFAAGVCVPLLARRSNLTGLFLCLTATGVILLLTLSASLSSVNQKTIKPLALELKKRLHPEDEVVTYYKYFQDLPIYIERRISIVTNWRSPEIPNRDNWVRELWYGMVFQDTKDWLINEDVFWQRWNSKKRLFVLVTTDDYNDLKTKAKAIFKIAEHHKVLLVSNQPISS